ncbi:MAG: TonB-dependent receptor plug domain-containing protein, partial [Terriglobia bacterium]
TNGGGSYSFVAVQPSTYTVRVEMQGFKVAERTNVNVLADDRVSMGEVRLEIGTIRDTVQVEEHVAQVATDSSQVTGAITGTQLMNLTARGRDVVSLLRTIPGVSYQSDPDSAGGAYGTGTPSIVGTNSGTNHIAVDGVTSNDQGSPNVFSSVTTLDAIGEVKVLLNSYQAEYTGNGGPIVQVVTKSGSKDFHGSVYEFFRNEDLNANNFFNNRNSAARPLYRYNTPGGTLGGPIYIPGHWNTSKDKLFGFYNIDIQAIKTPGNLTSYTMPSALERKGDFSQTLDLNGAVIPIKDTLNGGAQFPNNVIPPSRLNPNGQALLNVLPLPNFLNRAVSLGNYNYQIQETLQNPKRSQLFKIDYVPTDKDRFYVRGKTFLSQQEGYSVSSGASPVGFFGQCYCFTESGLAIVGTHIFGPRTVLEYNTGVRHNHEAWHPFGENGATDQQELDKVTRSKIGYNLGQWYPQSNPNGWIPRYTFGGVTSPPNVNYDSRFLTGGTDFGFNADAALSVTREKHLMKFGVSFLRDREYEGETSTFSGTFDFGKNTLNPLDSNYAFSNAALGVFNSYSESNARYGANLRQSTVEWFAQDSWKPMRNLTINGGIRWSWYQEAYPHYDGQLAQFALSRYDPSQAPPLYRPLLVNGVRQAQNPLTGGLLSAPYIGAFVPGVGNPGNGGVVSGDPNYPRGFINQQPVLWGPRLGFAYDPFGRGKTVIRGGSAILYTIRETKWNNFVGKPPAVYTPVANFGNMSTFLQSAGLLSPGVTSGYDVNNKTPVNYSLNFGIQQDLGHSFILDVSYASTLGRHIEQSVNINNIPYGARFLPQNADASNSGKPLPDNFFRKYPGYSNITITSAAYSSNYHSLLTTINRRFSHGLTMGLSYTFSKYLDYTGIPTFQPLRQWSYGFDGSDQTHNVVINYTYDLPKASKLRDNRFVRFAGDGWTLAGISQFVSGTPASISFSTVQGTDLTGGGDGQRVMVVGDPNANGSTFSAWFNPAAFALPPGSSTGNASKNSVRNPGVNNNDMTLSKRFPIRSEGRFLQLRWEAYNVFNHTQYSGINTAAKYDLVTGAQTNAQFGQVTSARTSRVMQGVLRFVF